MSTVIEAREGPLAITEERGDGRTYVLTGENTAGAAASATAAAASASAADVDAAAAAASASAADVDAAAAAASASAADVDAAAAAASAAAADVDAAAAAASAAAAALAIWEPEGAWVTATAYTVSPRSVVSQGGNGYGCLVPHTSGTFATDLAAGKWALVVEKGTDGAAYTDEQVRDVIGAAVTDTGIAVITVNDAGDTIDINVPAASTTEVLTGTEAAKAVTPDALAALWEKGSDVASAATVSLGEGGYFNVTGTTTITDIDFATDKAGRAAWVKFVGVLTLTHHATTLILPSGASITTAAGDTALFVSEGTDAVRCVAYMRASGAALVSSGGSSQFFTQASPPSIAGPSTLAIADMLTGLLVIPTAGGNLTLPTGTVTDAGIAGGSLAVDRAFDWTVVNTINADSTLIASAGHTIVGAALIGRTGSGPDASVTFRTRKTATNTFVTYRLS